MLRPLIGLAGCRTLTVNSPYKAFPATIAHPCITTDAPKGAFPGRLRLVFNRRDPLLVAQLR
jgi:hypothetical protein